MNMKGSRRKRFCLIKGLRRNLPGGGGGTEKTDEELFLIVSALSVIRTEYLTGTAKSVTQCHLVFF
jgi:hypothetical protein